MFDIKILYKLNLKKELTKISKKFNYFSKKE